MNVDFHVIIPARYESSRLPGKLLMQLGGQTVIERVYRQVLLANPQSVTIATDNPLIAACAASFGAVVKMTATTHQSGTDRIAEVVSQSNYPSDAIIVNVQGDEPFIPPALIRQVASSLATTDVPMATLCWPLDDKALWHNPNVVKVVRDKMNQALYFSRSPIPSNRDNPGSMDQVFRHIGLYAYRAAFLLSLVQWPVCALEQLEALEQLRVLWAGYKIKVEDACEPPQQDINTMEDYLASQIWYDSNS